MKKEKKMRNLALARLRLFGCRRTGILLAALALALTIVVGMIQPGEVVRAAEQTQGQSAQTTDFSGEQTTQTQSGRALVEDAADLLTPEEEAAVLQELQQLADQSGWTCFALTTADAGGKTAREYADDYVDANAAQEDGVCFLIDMDNREIYLCTTGEAIRYLTDYRVERVLDEGYPKVSEGAYRECFLAMIQQTERFFEQGIPAGQYNQDELTGAVDPYNREKREPELTSGEIAAAFFAAIAAALIAVFVVVRRYRIKVSDFQYDFHENSVMNLSAREDRLVNQFVTRRHIPRQTSSGGSRSTTHRSSGGGTHGGGGRRF